MSAQARTPAYVPMLPMIEANGLLGDQIGRAHV